MLLLDHSPYRNRYPWGLPGGWHRPGETLSETLVRELDEETGFAINVDSVFRLISRFPYPRIEVVFTGHIVGGEVRMDEEICGLQWIGSGGDYSMILPRHRDVLASYFGDGPRPFEVACDNRPL